MTDDKLQSHVDDVLNFIKENSKEKVNREEIESEIEKFMEYGVPIDQAKQTLIKKYAGDVSFTPSADSSERKPISELQPNERSVNLLCRVVAINPKEITVKGEKKNIFYGILGDESGTVPFTAWNEIDVEKGDVVEISNAYTKEWQGSVQLNLGDRVGINKTDKDKIPKTAFEPKEVKVKDLKSGMGSVDVKARVLELKERDVQVNDESKKVFSGTIGDETGKAQFTSWHDWKLKEGEVFEITGGYVKSWKGIPQLTFDEKAKVKKLDKSSIPKDRINLVEMPLHELVEKRGGLDVKISGTVIEIRPGSGFIMRCAECNRSLQDGKCSIHGEVKGQPDLRIKLVVDDGIGAVNSVMNREATEKILGKSLEECKKMGEEKLNEEMNKLLFAKKISMHGNALGDEFGTTVIAKDAEIIDVNVAEEAEKLSEELEDLL